MRIGAERPAHRVVRRTGYVLIRRVHGPHFGRVLVALMGLGAAPRREAGDERGDDATASDQRGDELDCDLAGESRG